MLAAKPRSCYMFVLAVLRGSIGLQNAGHERAGIWSAQSATHPVLLTVPHKYPCARLGYV